MGCPHGGSSGSLSKYFRRDILKTCLAAGGVASLAACIEQEGTLNIPAGFEDLSAVPERQFAWNDYMALDLFENTTFPVHQLILIFDYEGDFPPSTDDKDAVARTFDSLDIALQRGNGGEDPYSADGRVMPGLLYMFGYSHSYFDGFDEELSHPFYSPEELLERTGETDPIPDDFDAALVLTSDHVQVLLTVEMAILGNLDTINDVKMKGSFDGVFALSERRTGFVGPNVTNRKLENDDIPNRSPMAMGFVSGFADNQARESRVSIDEGPFENGSLLQISQLELNLEEWYDLPHSDRIELMFSPDHTSEDVGEIGQLLSADSGLTKEMEEALDEHKRDGRVGHTQKLALSRDENFEPKILRRSEALSTGDPHPGMNFTSLQRDLEDFVEVRNAMDADQFEENVDIEENGILNYHEVNRRATFLVPPRSKIALPSPGG